MTSVAATELDHFLARYPGTRTVDLFFTNLSGVPRGIRLRRHELAAAFADGRHLPGALLVLDVTGRDLDDGGQSPAADADRRALPVPGTLTPAPWLGPDAAQAMIGLFELDGTPCTLDPRRVLARVLARFAADGLTPVVACELEFFLIDPHRKVDGGIRQRRGSGGRRTGEAQVFGLDADALDDGYLRALWAACDAMGVPAGAAISEYAPGQIEVTLTHRDALAACDDAVCFKRAAKGLAAAHGAAATFMAKPLAGCAGSGLHVHVSVEDRAGLNIFAADAPAGSAALRAAVGGACATMADATALFAPNANSYRRLARPDDAPMRASWGVNSRLATLRVPAGAPHGRRIEHRVAGADANPYLAVAAVLAGIHHGLTHRIDPGPPVAADGSGATGERLPSDWAYAIERCDRSAVLRDYLGDGVVGAFAAIKRAEAARFNAVVPALDYDWLLAGA